MTRFYTCVTDVTENAIIARENIFHLDIMGNLSQPSHLSQHENSAAVLSGQEGMMSAIELIIEHAERVGELSVTKIDAARAELSALRATVAEQARRLDEANTTIAGQAEQLKNSIDLIRRIWEMADNETSTFEIESTSLMWQIEADLRAWLAATAPAPQSEQPETIAPNTAA